MPTIFFVAPAECFVLFQMYHSDFSDFNRFGVPTIVALLLNIGAVHLCGFGRRRHPLVLSALIALGVTAISTYVGMLICINTMGT